jgi:predicted transcriptional regulator
VDNILEPLCHQKRFEILKAISAETKSFSALSKLTGLRGGNLLFHLQKLVEKGMIIQRHERGDYMITGKGFKVMEGVSSIYSALEPESEGQDEDSE